MNKPIPPILLTVFITMMLHFTGNSQALYPVSLDEKVDESTLIIEGKVKEKISFWNPQHTMIYTSNKVEVYKVFKGSVIIDTIEVMTQGGSVGDYSIEVSDVLDLNIGDIGVFFCLPNPINLRSPSTHQQLWDVYSSAQGCFKYSISDGTASAPFVKYTNIQDQFYPQIEQKTNRHRQIINQSFRPYKQQQLRVTGTPVITGFSPSMVKAGSFAEASENVLTINGSGFGTPSGSAGINFDNPDDGTGGTPFFVAATSDLIVSWADAQIVVKVPAKVGTGTFSIAEAGGLTGNSPTALQVKYAILNATYGASPIYRQYSLMNVNGSGGYNFVYSTNTAGSGADFSLSSQKTTFERALTTWNEVAGLNFVYAGTTTSQTVNAGDGTNIIMLDNTNTGVAPLSAGILALTYSSGLSCGGSQYVQRSGFDMIIRNPGVSSGTTNFNFGPCKTATGTTEYDLETTILHEIGHALNLGHINDSYVNGGFPNIDPAKLMNYAIINGAERRSPDWSSFAGAKYCINPRSLSYGSCTGQTEMTPLTPIVESKDECPVTFPSSATPSNTFIAFDLNHATSNKYGDPQFTAVNCTGTGTGVTNTVYYAIKTGAAGAITLTVSGYSTTPSTQQSCTGAGVEMALYQTSSCPAGQSFPSPVACRTFNASGVLSNFTGLAANTNYLIMVDGISNSKANFNLLFNGSALPLKLTYFSGTSSAGYNTLKWKAENIISVDKLGLEGSIDGINFTQLYEKIISTGVNTVEDNFNDYAVKPVKYYRLKIFNKSGSAEYSNIIMLKQNINMDVLISPNPVQNYVNASFYKISGGTVVFTLNDMAGKLLNTEKIIAVPGQQTVQLSIAKGILPGNYILQVNTGETSSSYKILVQ